MKYKVFTDEIFEGVKNSPAIKDFFSEEFYKLKTQRYYNVFLEEISKLTSIPCDVSNKQSPTTCELLNMMQSVWDANLPLDLEHKVILNGWKSYNDTYGKTSIEKLHSDLYNAYLFCDTEKIIEYKNRDCYATADEEKYSKLLSIFVGNFGFSDPSMTYKFLHSWFMIVKRGFTTKEENRNLALLFVSKNNRTGKSRLSEFIGKGISEYLHTPITHSTTTRLVGKFNHLPKTNGVIILNECTKQDHKGSSTLKDILGNEAQEIEYKGVSDRVHSINHNVFIGSANEFLHLENMEDTRFLNIPLDSLKYTVHGVHNYGKQIVNLVKEILAAAPETDCDESSTIISLLNSWNNKKGDDTEWMRDLYLSVNGDVNELKRQLIDYENKPLTGKKSIAAKIAQIVNIYNGGIMTSKAISGLAYKIAKHDEIFICKSMRFDISEDIFANVEFDEENNNDKNVSRPWSESPIYKYYQAVQTPPSIIYQVQPSPSLHPQPSQMQTPSLHQTPSQSFDMKIDKKIEPAGTVDFDFNPEWSDPDAPENVKYEPFTVGDMVLYLPVYTPDEQHTEVDEQHTEVDEQHTEVDEQPTEVDEQRPTINDILLDKDNIYTIDNLLGDIFSQKNKENRNGNNIYNA